MNFWGDKMFTISEETKSQAKELAAKRLNVSEAIEFNTSGGTMLLSSNNQGMIPLYRFDLDGQTYFVGLSDES